MDFLGQAESGRSSAWPARTSVWKYVMSLPMKWWISVFSSLRHQSSRSSPCCLHHCLRRADVADRGVEPDVPVIAGTVGNLEAEVRRRPRDVPIVQRLAQEVALQIVGDLGLKVPAALRPLFEKPVQLLDVDEQVVGLAHFRLAAGKRAHRVDQVGRV